MSSTTRRRTLRAVAPLAGLLAAGLLVWQGSYAAFSATTTNPANSWSAGTVSLTDDDTGGNSTTTGFAMFSAGTPLTPAANTGAGSVASAALVPNQSVVNCIKVTNNGTLAGPVKVYVPSFTQTNALAGSLKVTIEEGTGTAATVFGNCLGFTSTSTVASAVLLSAAATTYAGGYGSAGNLAVAASRYYRVTVQLDNLAPNTVQGGTATAPIQWEIQA